MVGSILQQNRDQLGVLWDVLGAFFDCFVRVFDLSGAEFDRF